MKTIFVLVILLWALVLPASSELTDADFDKIHLIVKEEIAERKIEELTRESEELKFPRIAHR